MRRVDYGFQREGFKHIAAFDNDPDAVNTFRRNVGSSAELCDLSVGRPLGALKE